MDDRDYSKPVKEIFNLLPLEQRELMRPQLKSMVAYVKKTGDTKGKGAEKKFRLFMLLYRHWLLSEKNVRSDYFGKSFIQATTDELWREARILTVTLKKGPDA